MKTNSDTNSDRSPQVELIVDEPCQLGENPLWHPLEKRLYWADIIRGLIFRYDPASGRHELCYQGKPAGGLTFQADGSLLLFMDRGRIARWHEGRLETIISEIPGEERTRFNDVIADPAGRVFCGTMPMEADEKSGRLYRLDCDGSLHRILDGVIISNGMGFTLDHRGFYYTDSGCRTIYHFDYDEASGAITHQRAWIETPEGAGVPDGMKVDAEGSIWSARWDGYAVHHYSSSGVELERIAFPARKITSVAFGGDDLTDLYVTSALAGGDRTSEGAGGGALFKLNPGVRGLSEFFSRI